MSDILEEDHEVVSENSSWEQVQDESSSYRGPQEEWAPTSSLCLLPAAPAHGAASPQPATSYLSR